MTTFERDYKDAQEGNEIEVLIRQSRDQAADPGRESLQERIPQAVHRSGSGKTPKGIRENRRVVLSLQFFLQAFSMSKIVDKLHCSF